MFPFFSLWLLTLCAGCTAVFLRPPLSIVLESPSPLCWILFPGPRSSAFLVYFLSLMGHVLQCFLWKSVGGKFSETNVFVSPLHLIGNLPELRILIWKWFSFRIMKAFPHWFWAPVWVLRNRKPFFPVPNSLRKLMGFFSGPGSVVLMGSSVCLFSQPVCQACQLSVPYTWGHFLKLSYSLFLPSILCSFWNYCCPDGACAGGSHCS